MRLEDKSLWNKSQIQFLGTNFSPSYVEIIENIKFFPYVRINKEYVYVWR